MSDTIYSSDGSYYTDKYGEEGWENTELSIHGVVVEGSLCASESESIEESYEEISPDKLTSRFCFDDLREGNVVDVVFSDRINKTYYRVELVEMIDGVVGKLGLEPYDKRSNYILTFVILTEQGRIHNPLVSYKSKNQQIFDADDSELMFGDNSFQKMKSGVTDISVIPDEVLLYAYDDIHKLMASKI